MSSYDEHLISMAGGDGDPLDAIEARAKDLTDLCPDHLRQGIRHLQRNCDMECPVHDEEAKWYDCNQPDRYDGGRMAEALSDIPALLELVRTQQATLAAVLNLANTSGRCGWRISADELRKTLRGES